MSLTWSCFQVYDQTKTSRNISPLSFACFDFIWKTIINLETFSWVFSVLQQVERAFLLSQTVFFHHHLLPSYLLQQQRAQWLVRQGHQIPFHSGSTVRSRAGCIRHMIWNEWASNASFLEWWRAPEEKGRLRQKQTTTTTTTTTKPTAVSYVSKSSSIISLTILAPGVRYETLHE